MSDIRTCSLPTFISTVYVPEMQEAETVLFSLFSRLDIDNATGETLRNIGKIAGTTFFRADNEDLTRRIIKGTIAAMNSLGTIENVDTAFKIITGSDSSYINILYPKSLELCSAVDFDAETAQAIFDVMKKAVPADTNITQMIYFDSNTCQYNLHYYDDKYYAETIAE